MLCSFELDLTHSVCYSLLQAEVKVSEALLHQNKVVAASRAAGSKVCPGLKNNNTLQLKHNELRQTWTNDKQRVNDPILEVVAINSQVLKDLVHHGRQAQHIFQHCNLGSKDEF